VSEGQHHDVEVIAPAWVAQTVPALLVAAVLGLGGLFLQVTKIDQALSTLQSDITELKTDSKERLADLEDRVRKLEMGKVLP
jgi:hypothetical protein